MIPILSGNVASALPSGYEVANSCRFNVGDDPKLSRTSPNSSPTNADKFTFSCWIKRSVLGARQQIYDTYNGSSGGQFQIYFKDDDTLRIQVWNSSSQAEFIPNRKFRDVSAWMNIIFAYDSTPSTPSSSSIKLFINGTQETSFATETYPSQNTDGEFAIQNHIQMIGNDNGNSRDCGLYLTEVVGVDGQALAQTQFGEFDEDSPTIWKPRDVSGINVGTLGFYLDFEDSSNLGNDVSGVGDFTATNLDATDQATDTCTNNFCTMNPLQAQADDLTFAQGNLKITNTGNAWRSSYGTFGSANGKFYFEVKCQASSDYERFGIVDADAMDKQSADGRYDDVGYNSRGYGYGSDGEKTNNGGSPSWGNAWGAGDILGCAFDLTNGKLYFSKNGTFQESGDPTSGSTGTGSAYDIDTGYVYIPALAHYGSGSSMEFNFGGCPSFSISSGNADANGYGNFEYAPPTGYFSLCTKNLAEYG